MDDLIRNIYINILKCGHKYKTVDIKDNCVYIDLYMKTYRYRTDRKFLIEEWQLACRNILKPRGR